MLEGLKRDSVTATSPGFRDRPGETDNYKELNLE